MTAAKGNFEKRVIISKATDRIAALTFIKNEATVTLKGFKTTEASPSGITINPTIGMINRLTKNPTVET